MIRRLLVPGMALCIALTCGCRFDDWDSCEWESARVQSDCRTLDLANTSLANLPDIRFCTIPAGCFRMGSPDDEPCRESNETLHPVTLTRSFDIAETEVTREQFKAATGTLSDIDPPADVPSGCPRCPHQQLSWHHAALFCDALSQASSQGSCYDLLKKGACSITDPGKNPCDPSYACVGGQCMQYQVKAAYAPPLGTIYDCPGFRLPTEAEWEYAYRAGTSTASFAGPVTRCDSTDDVLRDYAYYDGGTVSVKTTLPNGWGLYDMAGNVFEWCHDGFQLNLGQQPAIDPEGPDTILRVLRNGNWDKLGKPRYLRAAYRSHYDHWRRHYQLGFRCARTRP